MSDEHIKVLREYRARTDCPRERAALDAAIAALGGGWLPIESAPRDGRSIMFYIPGKKRPEICRADDFWYGRPDARGDGHAHWLNGATHWQPLPAPPSKEG